MRECLGEKNEKVNIYVEVSMKREGDGEYVCVCGWVGGWVGGCLSEEIVSERECFIREERERERERRGE